MNPQEDNMQLPAVDPSVDDANSTQSAPANPQFSAPAQPQIPQPQSSGAAPAIAGDVDLIEKEWVEKAKKIVNSTMGNPHAQSQQINQMKADYIKKRYNKEIRSEDK